MAIYRDLDIKSDCQYLDIIRQLDFIRHSDIHHTLSIRFSDISYPAFRKGIADNLLSDDDLFILLTDYEKSFLALLFRKIFGFAI